MAMSDELRNGNPTADRGLARLYREAAREQPPAHLDAAILAAAHRDVGALPRPLGSAWLRSWRLPVSIAAVVVLSVSVVLLMVEEGGEPFTEPPRSVPKAVPQPAEAVDQASAPSKPAAPASTPASELSGARDTTGETRLAKNSTAKGAGKQSAPAPSADPVPQPFPATPPSVASSGQRAADLKPARPPDDARERPDEAPRSARLRSLQPESTRESAPSTIGIGGLSEQAPPAPSGPVAPQSAPPASAAKLGSTPRQSALIREYEHQAPEKWIEKIAELKRDGKTTEADEMLAEFKKRFPKHPLPARLR